MNKLSLTLSLLLCSSAGAVNTLFLEHNSEAQFKDGTFENILINSQGLISLAPQAQTIETDDQTNWVINDLAVDSLGAVYAATSGQGAVYRLTDNNKLESIWSPGKQINHVFSIAISADDTLLAGTGGAKGELYLRDNKKFKKIWSDDKAGYIWDILISPTGKVYLATGPEGMIYATDLKGGSTEVIYDAPVKNILALALSPDGTLYAASDESGLVYKADLATKTVSVAYDTGKEEVSSLCLDKAGNVYIATAGSSTARPGAKLVLSDNNDQPAPQTPQVEPEPMADEAPEPAATPAPATSKKIRQAEPQQSDDDNNLVLKLTPSGYVEKIFSAPVVIHDLALTDDESKLYLATGIEGKLIAIELADNTSSEIFDSKSSQISALLLANDRIYAGCADKAALTILENRPAANGSFVSEPFDAKGPANWGLLYITGENLADNTIISLRTGNTADPENGGWSNWTPTQLTGPAIKGQIPVGRFLQYKLQLKSSTPGITTTISEVKAAYSSINLKPQIEEFAIQQPEGKQKLPPSELKKIMFHWQAQDENEDKLISDVLIKSNTSTGWVRIADDLDEEEYQWDTTLAPDGVYTIKLIVSDELDNPSATALTAEKTTSGILVDNTAPEINALTISADNNAFLVKLTACDALSVIERVEYSVDSDKTFRSAICDDGISDSYQENFSFTMTAKATGLHFVTIKVTDIAGNSRFMTREFKN